MFLLLLSISYRANLKRNLKNEKKSTIMYTVEVGIQKRIPIRFLFKGRDRL